MQLDSIPYHLPTLPLPLLCHQSVLQQRELASELNILDCGKVQIEGLTQEVLDAIVEKQPTWRAKWFRQRPADKVLYNLAPIALQYDPIYCPIRRKRSWESYQMWSGDNVYLLNYPLLPSPPPNTLPTEQYVTSTLKAFNVLL